MFFILILLRTELFCFVLNAQALRLRDPPVGAALGVRFGSPLIAIALLAGVVLKWV